MDAPADAVLWARWREGDREALAALYDRHSGALYAYLLGMTGDAALAQDLVHETFVRLMRPLAAVPRSVRAFLFTIGRHLVVDDRRRAALPRPASRPAPCAGTDWEALEELDALPPEQRDVVLLKVFAGMTFEEIAGLSDAPLQTVASRYRYAIEKLARRWEDER